MGDMAFHSGGGGGLLCGPIFVFMSLGDITFAELSQANYPPFGFRLPTGRGSAGGEKRNTVCVAVDDLLELIEGLFAEDGLVDRLIDDEVDDQAQLPQPFGNSLVFCPREQHKQTGIFSGPSPAYFNTLAVKIEITLE